MKRKPSSFSTFQLCLCEETIISYYEIDISTINQIPLKEL